MARRKLLKEITIKNNFMFGAVMCDEKNCKGLLERVLNIPIERVEVSKEKSILYHPMYKGIRLDVYAKDEQGTHYDIEMQALTHPALEKRSRYYHSQMDMELLQSGEDYEQLPNAYVIFICDFDPFRKRKYCYTFESVCQEDKDLVLNDGRKSIFLSTEGENEEEVSPSLVKFLQFVKADLLESEKDFEDDFVKSLQDSVQRVKESREMEKNFMLFQEFLKEERKQGRAEGRAEGLEEGRAEGREEGREEGRVEGIANSIVAILEDKGSIPQNLRDRITQEKDLDVLGQWVKKAALAESVTQFLEQI